MKLESDVRQEIYDYIKCSELLKSVRGRLFKFDEERPDDNVSEDIVICVLTEPNINELQDIIVLVRVYVADLFDSCSKLYREDGIRISELEKLCLETFEVFRTKGSRCSLSNMKTFKVEAKNEHCIVNRITYKFCNY